MYSATKARALYEAGRLDEAIAALGAELRDRPDDAWRRTFLFELLCFAGQYDRAEKQLDVLASGKREAELGAWLYRSALHAERTRLGMYQDESLPAAAADPPPVSGTLNGRPFNELTDADPRIGARLEIYAAGQYTWVPFEHVSAVHMAPPRQLRDLIWAPARVQTGPGFRGVELGEVLLPALTPLAWRHPEDAVRLGRETDWEELADGRFAPVGQKLLLVDGEPFPILELRDLVIDSPAEPPN